MEAWGARPTVKKFLKDITTGIDGKTYDAIRVYMLLGVIVFLGCTTWHLYDDNIFSFIEFGTGLAAIFAGGGAGIGFKQKTEPEAT